ncbi:PAS domain-containing sensor histidine kinase [Dehalogenimonas alkenigignens]|uniref:PAS domain S-box n=1 Tax=Dehalogenimonas alkenigignens TaxID=1217799 RepID=A0A0W0GIW1_9CHLR|nr:PAS domain S-box protein [Dehalogenimonas alkenigignens]KTB48456.1 PAS domain S-box [Dehalogenimonas alkenigignens]PVV85092.1 PAS domain S-box protein [Dehalogenimonas alkenigignens]
MDNYALFLLDETGFIECNQKAEELFGAVREELIGRTPSDYSPQRQPDGRISRDKAREKIRAAMDGAPQLFEWKHLKADGTCIDTEISLNRIGDGDRRIVMAIVRDISDLKKAEESRLESEQMFRSIVENSHSGIFTVDEAFTITYANDMVSLLLGLPNDRIVGRDFREFLDEESANLVVDNYLRRQRGESLPARYEFNIVTASGDRRRVEISSNMIRDTAGRLKTVGQVLDVTDRHRAEDALRRAQEDLESRVIIRTRELQHANVRLEAEISRREQIEQALRRKELKYRHLVDSGNAIILELDTAGRIIFFNHFAERFFGYTESEVIGKSVVGTIVPARDSADADLEAMIRDIIHRPEDYRLNENENMKKNGDRVWVVWTNQPVYDEAGNLKEILCLGIDRTEQKKIEDTLAVQTRLQAAMEERARLARDLHDAVSQTLFSASIIAEVLPRIWDRSPDEGFRRLEEVRQLTRGALAEMRTLLFELRPAALAEAELPQLLTQLGESVTGRARLPVNVSITGGCELPAEVKIALYRIAQEALNNVVKHSGATLAEVSLCCQGSGIALSVADNGNGFDAAAEPQGRLGLSIMKERAASVNAGITIDSSPGKGTEVTVNWPMNNPDDPFGDPRKNN